MNPSPSLSPSRWWRLLAATVLATLAVLVGPATPALAASTASTGTTADAAGDEQTLAERYAPVTRLVQQAADCGPGEPFLPTDVDTLLGNDTVALRGPWDTDDLVKIAPTGTDLAKGLSGYHLDFPGSPLSPGCSYEEWANEQTEGATPTTYARVVTEEGREGLALQYWLYYPFNDFNNKHESDWEMIQVEFAASDAATALTQEPTRVGYSQHEGVEIADWGDVKLEVVDGTHPVVHPAAGSHANYYDAALFLGRSGQQGFGCDDTRAPTVDVRPAVALVPSDAAAVGAAYPWLDYTGRWGQRETSFYNGPTGPNTKDQWTEPLTWTDEEGAPTAYAVPASGLYGTKATSSFCGIVVDGLGRPAARDEQPGRCAAVAPGRARPARHLAGAPHDVAPLGAAAAGPPPQHRPGHRRRVADVPRADPAVRRHRRCRSPSRPILPGVATVWVTSVTESHERQRDDPATVLVGPRRARAHAAVTGDPGPRSGGDDVRRPRDRRGPAGRAAARLRRCPASRRAAAAHPVGPGLRARLLAVTVVCIPVAVVLLVLSLLITPVVLFEGISGWKAVRRSAHLVRRRWLKVVVLVALTNALVLGIGPLLGTDAHPRHLPAVRREQRGGRHRLRAPGAARGAQHRLRLRRRHRERRAGAAHRQGGPAAGRGDPALTGRGQAVASGCGVGVSRRRATR